MKDYNLLPADTYMVINKSIINNEDRKILNMLYQPIIGPIPVALYFSLWSDLDKLEVVSNEYTHHHLITNMHLSLDEIVSARRKLEAIGLIKTFFKEENSISSYIYELYSPISAHEFLTHPILNITLYNNLGKDGYQKIVNYFKLPRISTSNYIDITSSFDSVFDSVPLTSYDIVNDDIRKYNKLKLNINSNFDFNFLLASFPKSYNIDKIFTKDIKELIVNLSFIYELDALKMQGIIKISFNDRGLISKEELRKNCRNYYQFENGGVLPTIIDNTQPEYLRKPVGDTSNRSKMIYTFETTSPRDLLSSYTTSGEPTRRDLKLVEDLVVDYGLTVGVVNVLIDYVLKTNENKLSRNFVETIAGQWKRLKIETVEDAMALAEKEHKKYNKHNVKVNTKNISNESVPDWFDKEIIKKEADSSKRSELEEMLKEYR